jgi:cyclophilin family peptidyl-prolyl cis-trans isomerase
MFLFAIIAFSSPKIRFKTIRSQKMIKNVSSAVLFMLLFSVCTFRADAQKERSKENTSSTPLVEIKTDYGTMVLRLYDQTPAHRDNFLKLARQGFYDSLLFHRIIPAFMIQGGDPESKYAEPGKMLGNGDVGYTIPAEFNDSLYHKKGALCAARTENPEKASSGCQFYIVQGKTFTDADLNQMEERINAGRKQGAMTKVLTNPANAEVKNRFLELKKTNSPDSMSVFYKTVLDPLMQKEVKLFKYSDQQRNIYKTVGGTPHLDQGYTVYGEVIEGLDVLDKIAAVQTGAGDRPVQDVRMTVKVLEKPAR